jgi:hypothetical protein
MIGGWVIVGRTYSEAELNAKGVDALVAEIRQSKLDEEKMLRSTQGL